MSEHPLITILSASGGTRHYHVEPDPADRTKPEKRRVWPWKEMSRGDFVIVDYELANAARSAASQYGKRHGEQYRSWDTGLDVIIYRDT